MAKKTAPLRPPGATLSRALREFVHTEAAGGVVVLVGALVALVWANSPWHSGYEALWHTSVNLRIGPLAFDEDLRELVNEALMALFFFVVGMEVKRELVAGELRSWRRASLPAIGAVGGMVVPALAYLALAGGSAGSRGWGIPMATDIAFAVGIVALLGSRVPPSLKLFLLTLAIVDDLGAIVVIAAFYSDGIDFGYLAGAGGMVVAVAGARLAGIGRVPVYVLLGGLVWYFTYRSGVHPTIAGALLGLLTPARPPGRADGSRPESSPPSCSVAERLEHLLHPWTMFAVVPLFALANAGVRIESDSLGAQGAGPVMAGVIVGLVVGKPVGITLFAWLAVRLGVGTLPRGVGWPQMAAVATVAGIGFTVSLFIAGLAFAGPELEAAAKVGIVVASAVAAVIGTVLLRATAPRPDPAPKPRAEEAPVAAPQGA